MARQWLNLGRLIPVWLWVDGGLIRVVGYFSSSTEAYLSRWWLFPARRRINLDRRNLGSLISVAFPGVWVVGDIVRVGSDFSHLDSSLICIGGDLIWLDGIPDRRRAVYFGSSATSHVQRRLTSGCRWIFSAWSKDSFPKCLRYYVGQHLSSKKCRGIRSGSTRLSEWAHADSLGLRS